MARIEYEQKTIGDVLAFNMPTFSFKVIEIKSGEGELEIGTLIAKNDAGQYVKSVSGGAAGADNTRHVLTEKIDATSVAVKTNVPARIVMLKRAGIEFDASYDSEAKIQAAFALLEVHQIIIAEEQ